jgi:hypothetical protein
MYQRHSCRQMVRKARVNFGVRENIASHRYRPFRRKLSSPQLSFIIFASVFVGIRRSRVLHRISVRMFFHRCARSPTPRAHPLCILHRYSSAASSACVIARLPTSHPGLACALHKVLLSGGLDCTTATIVNQSNRLRHLRSIFGTGLHLCSRVRRDTMGS